MDEVESRESTLRQQVKKIRENVLVMAKELNISHKEVLALLMQRELVIANTTLAQSREMLDLLCMKKAKEKGG